MSITKFSTVKTCFTIPAVTRNFEEDFVAYIVENTTQDFNSSDYNFVSYGISTQANDGNLATFEKERDQKFTDESYIVGYGWELSDNMLLNGTILAPGEAIWLVQTETSLEQLGLNRFEFIRP